MTKECQMTNDQPGHWGFIILWAFVIGGALVIHPTRYVLLTLPKIVVTVFQMITKSSHQLRVSTYSMSYLIHSWKSLPRRRVRLICQRPVMPGRTLRRASRQGGQNWFSW